MTREQLMVVIAGRQVREWRREGVAGYGLLFDNVPLDIRLDDNHVVTMVFDQVIA